MFGAVPLFAGGPYPASALAVIPSTAVQWGRDVAAQLTERHPAIFAKVLAIPGERSREIQNRYLELAAERVDRRVARAVLQRARPRDGADSGREIHFPISRRHLAHGQPDPERMGAARDPGKPPAAHRYPPAGSGAGDCRRPAADRASFRLTALLRYCTSGDATAARSTPSTLACPARIRMYWVIACRSTAAVSRPAIWRWATSNGTVWPSTRPSIATI